MRLFPTFLLAALFTTGCSTPYKTPAFGARDGGDATFLSVADQLKSARPLDALFVHGMCTQDADWASKGCLRC